MMRDLLESSDLNALGSSALKTDDKCYTHLELNKIDKPTFHLYCGDISTGKSLKASKFNDIYWKDDTKWWDGYDKHETVGIDDFRYEVQ